jgi:short-subunit dehydrogenase
MKPMAHQVRRRRRGRIIIMSRIFISGSSTGLGLMAADLLASKGHSVVLHARNAKRAEAARQKLPRVEAIVVGDVETIAGAKGMAAQVNGRRFDPQRQAFPSLRAAC